MHLTKVTVESSSLDKYGHINYKEYPKILEQGQDDFMLQVVGMSFDDIESQLGLRSFVRSMNLDFIADADEVESLELYTRVERVGTTSITFTQRILKGKQIIGDFELVVVLVDKNERSVPVPEELRKRLTPE